MRQYAIRLAVDEGYSNEEAALWLYFQLPAALRPAISLQVIGDWLSERRVRRDVMVSIQADAAMHVVSAVDSSDIELKRDNVFSPCEQNKVEKEVSCCEPVTREGSRYLEGENTSAREFIGALGFKMLPEGEAALEAMIVNGWSDVESLLEIALITIAWDMKESVDPLHSSLIREDARHLVSNVQEAKYDGHVNSDTAEAITKSLMTLSKGGDVADKELDYILQDLPVRLATRIS